MEDLFKGLKKSVDIFIQAFKHCYVINCLEFKGTTNRCYYWTFEITASILFMICYKVCFKTGNFIINSVKSYEATTIFDKMELGYTGIFWIIIFFFGLSLVIPSFAASVRRIRDAGKSPWWIGLYFILLLISLFFYYKRSEYELWWLLASIAQLLSLITSIIIFVYLCLPSKNPSETERDE